MSGRVRTKICGITCPDDAALVAAAGADAVGLNFYPPSPRCIDPETAVAICSALPPFVTVVGLCVDMPAVELARLVEQVPLDLLQFHGDETPAYCAAAPLPWMKAIRMRPGLDVAATAADYDGARGILVDAYVEGLPGGTGRSVDWHAVPALGVPLILAGGLRADNVAEAIETTRPWAVDVCGGVERAPGIKDPERVTAFIRAVEQTAT